MRKLLPGVLVILLLVGCRTLPVSSETLREVVHQYLGSDVGTAGPFYGGGAKKELSSLLADKERKEAEALVDRGAGLFLVYGSRSADAPAAPRAILVHESRVVGDFRGVPTTP